MCKSKLTIHGQAEITDANPLEIRPLLLSVNCFKTDLTLAVIPQVSEINKVVTASTPRTGEKKLAFPRFDFCVALIRNITFQYQ